MDNNNWMQLFAEGAEGGTEGTPVEGGAAAPAAESGTQAHWQRVDQIYDGIVREAESLRELFPDLDLRRESRNELFCNLLRGGADVESAYCGAHFRELLPAAMAYAAEYTRAQLAASMAGGSRPAENGLTGSGAVKLGSSVAALSPSDYARLCRLVEQGHRVSFG